MFTIVFLCSSYYRNRWGSTRFLVDLRFLQKKDRSFLPAAIPVQKIQHDVQAGGGPERLISMACPFGKIPGRLHPGRGQGLMQVQRLARRHPKVRVSMKMQERRLIPIDVGGRVRLRCFLKVIRQGLAAKRPVHELTVRALRLMVGLDGGFLIIRLVVQKIRQAIKVHHAADIRGILTGCERRQV